MTKWICLAFFLLAFFSCISGNKKGKESSPVFPLSKQPGGSDAFSRAVPISQENDSIFSITIVPDCTIHWNNHSNKIVEDSLLEKVAQRYPSLKRALIDQISNTFATPAMGCPAAKPLATGDIAYLVLDKIRGLPIFAVTQTQFCVFEENCPYPLDFFDFMSNNREFVKKCVIDYLILN